jgi:hypothetical protein
MTEKQNLEINIVELVGLTANILDQLFFKAPKDKAKTTFKELKQGRVYSLGTVTIQKVVSPELKLALDYSEYCGPGFNFDAFKLALEGILKQISLQFKKKGDLNIMTSDQNSLLIHLPGMIQLGEQLNVMLMSFEMGNLEAITIKLMFVEPSQYDALRKQQD